jgi:hypothetical protein
MPFLDTEKGLLNTRYVKRIIRRQLPEKQPDRTTRSRVIYTAIDAKGLNIGWWSFRDEDLAESVSTAAVIPAVVVATGYDAVD